MDEPGKAQIALLPDEEDPEHNSARDGALWGALMAGAFGVEWYFGYASPHSDLTCQDFRSRDYFWDQNRYARNFFEELLPFWQMEPADELTTDTISYCLADKGNIYAVYLPAGLTSTAINLEDTGDAFSVHWFDPRKGGALQPGSVESVVAGDIVPVGNPPGETEKDWVVLIRVVKP